jgi:hypothetical protein
MRQYGGADWGGGEPIIGDISLGGTIINAEKTIATLLIPVVLGVVTWFFVTKV